MIHLRFITMPLKINAKQLSGRPDINNPLGTARAANIADTFNYYTNNRNEISQARPMPMRLGGFFPKLDRLVSHKLPHLQP